MLRAASASAAECDEVRVSLSALAGARDDVERCGCGTGRHVQICAATGG
jgi:hypothetical protein